MKNQIVVSNIYRKVMLIKKELQKANLKKSGKNRFAGFEYFELADFLPTLTELMEKYGIYDKITIKGPTMRLELINIDRPDEVIVEEIPFKFYETPLNKQGSKSMQDIQYYGALLTYYRRYLYLITFNITDGDIIDALNQNEITEKKEEVTHDMIRNLIGKTGTDTKKFLDYFKVTRIEDLSPESLKVAYKLLKNKLKKEQR